MFLLPSSKVELFVLFHTMPEIPRTMTRTRTRRQPSMRSSRAWMAIVASLLLFSPSKVHSFSNVHRRTTIQRRSCSHTVTTLQSQGVEEDFLLEARASSRSAAIARRWFPRFDNLSQTIRVDKKQIAELGMSFMLTYNLVSNINGSIFLSLSWYIASVRVSGVR